jgi:hypothetical protein
MTAYREGMKTKTAKHAQTETHEYTWLWDCLLCFDRPDVSLIINLSHAGNVQKVQKITKRM